MNSSINLNTITPQVNFAGKGSVFFKNFNYRKQALNENKVIDELNNKAIELANKDRSIEEKKETAIRKSLERIFKKLGFGKKLRNGGSSN